MINVKHIHCNNSSKRIHIQDSFKSRVLSIFHIVTNLYFTDNLTIHGNRILLGHLIIVNKCTYNFIWSPLLRILFNDKCLLTILFVEIGNTLKSQFILRFYDKYTCNTTTQCIQVQFFLCNFYFYLIIHFNNVNMFIRKRIKYIYFISTLFQKMFNIVNHGIRILLKKSIYFFQLHGIYKDGIYSNITILIKFTIDFACNILVYIYKYRNRFRFTKQFD